MQEIVAPRLSGNPELIPNLQKHDPEFTQNLIQIYSRFILRLFQTYPEDTWD